ncbi:hypothetical protein CFP65_6930 [Kitasatospora sp. MMS16-BH015]|uniref:DUF6426 family protein n=1 Tax=Kitasatospora sp. MMS16-BH015 TaxID=2018025 RepID=UPI000CA348EB|nr:DUF6426 family protein [Kitasatospora sp. MMS16-BH015]AUG81548.1 hypothetical protein CFP65_6930 [Kitasatospora sp. MMS16-BH015]
MKLRSTLAALALGTTVLTSAPALIAPQAALATVHCNSTICGPDEEPVFDDTGDDSQGGGGLTEEAPAEEVPIPTVVITGQRPANPLAPVFPPYVSGGKNTVPHAGSFEVEAVTWSPRFDKHGPCFGNDVPGAVAKKFGGTSYQVSYEANAGISVDAASIISGTLGIKVNQTVTVTDNLEVTLQAGQEYAVYVTYQTVTYKVTHHYLFSDSVEYVTITMPTKDTHIGACGN